MLANSLEKRKEELLNRIARERVQALDSAESVCRSVRVGVAAVQGSGRFIRYISLATTGLVAAGVCTLAAKGMRAAKQPVVRQATAKAGFIRTLLLQGATVVLFPYLRDLLTGNLAGTHPKRPFIFLSRYSPSHLFFRWLGLEK